MGKKIRHLEFYGYVDQNTYIGIPNVDLSEIREVNKEQDKEINAISGATKEKADIATVNELSGSLETFIENQTIINNLLENGVNNNIERIEGLERRDEEITNKINEIVDDFNPIYDELVSLNTRIDNVDNKLTQHLEESSTFEDEARRKFDALETELDKKLDKIEAYDVFANKSDVYTKQEINDLFDGFATEEWVMSRGFIREVDADGKYASKARLNALEDRVGNIQTTLYNQYNELNSDLSRYKTVTDSKINVLENQIDTLETKYDGEIGEIQEDINELNEKVTRNTNNIDNINNVLLPNKADKTALNALENEVNALSDSLDNKVDKAVYETDKTIFGLRLESLDDRKADKTVINAISGAISDFESELQQEKQDRISSDNNLGNRIDGIDERIDEIREENVGRDANISNLRRDLNKEINDRIEADNAIIGSENDREEDNTIYGAKKYARNVANNALNDSKTYTDTKCGSLRDYVDETYSDIERQITAKADKSYVDAIKSEIETSLDDKVNAERLRAETVESDIADDIEQERLRAIESENGISRNLAHTNNIVKALTDWDGDDREDYTDVGNGIIDVMHRELHQVRIDTSTTFFADAVYNKVDNKIHFKGFDGNEICTIDVSDIAPNVIERTWYENGIIFIKFTNGEIIEIDVKQLIDENEFSDGLQVINGVVSVKKDATSEEYLSVSENGVKVSGLDAEFTRLDERIDSISSGASGDVAAERARAMAAEAALDTRINQEIADRMGDVDAEETRAIAAENALNEKIDNITVDCGIY